jgi:Phage gp6-like head-tail connector protein
MPLVSLADVKVFLRVNNDSQDAQLTMFIGDAEAVFENYTHRRFSQDTYTEFASGNGTKYVILKNYPVQSILNVWMDYNGYFGFGVNADGSLPFNANTLQAPGTYFLELDDTVRGPVPAAWSSTTDYLPGTLVSLAPGQFYTCILENTNKTPPNLMYWSPCRHDMRVSKSGLLGRIDYAWPDIVGLYLPGNLARETSQFRGNIQVQYVAGYPTGYAPRDLQYACRMMVAEMRQTAPLGARKQNESVTDYSFALQVPVAGQPPAIGTVRQILNRYRQVPALGSDIAALASTNSNAWR